MPSNSAEYQREYRKARKAAAQGAPPPTPDDEWARIDAAARVTLPHDPMEDKVFPSGFHYLPGDLAIGRMTQQARDQILARMPLTGRKT